MKQTLFFEKINRYGNSKNKIQHSRLNSQNRRSRFGPYRRGTAMCLAEKLVWPQVG